MAGQHVSAFHINTVFRMPQWLHVSVFMINIVFRRPQWLGNMFTFLGPILYLEGHSGWATCFSVQDHTNSTQKATVAGQHVAVFRINTVFRRPPWLGCMFQFSGSMQYLEGHSGWAACFSVQDQYHI